LYSLTRQEVAEINPLGNVSYTSYNADSQVSLTVDADGRSIENSYTADGRLSSESWLNAAGVQTDAESFSYDNAGNVTAESNNYGTYDWTYNSANRAVSQTDPFGITLDVTYDDAGNITEMTDSDSGTLTSVYNTFRISRAGCLFSSTARTNRSRAKTRQRARISGPTRTSFPFWRTACSMQKLPQSRRPCAICSGTRKSTGSRPLASNT